MPGLDLLPENELHLGRESRVGADRWGNRRVDRVEEFWWICGQSGTTREASSQEAESGKEQLTATRVWERPLTGRIGANIVEVELNRVQCLAGTRAECQAVPDELGSESHSLSFL